MHYIATFMLFVPGAAHAYIDPGTGSMALQMLIGGILAGLFAIKLYWYRFKAWVRRIIGRKES